MSMLVDGVEVDTIGFQRGDQSESRGGRER